VKLLNDEEKSLWREAAANSAEVVDEEGIPAMPEEQAQAAAQYADLLIEEYRKRV
jgi:hypothetical protein